MKLLRIKIWIISPVLILPLISTATFSQQLTLSESKARLGEIHYSARVGGTVPTQGDTFLVQVLEEGDRLRKIQVGVNENLSFPVVQALRFTVEDSSGQLRKIEIGTLDSQWGGEVEVPEELVLVGISGASGWWIDKIRFHFSDGSASPAFGGSIGGDTDFRLILAQRNSNWKGRWLGVWGTYTDCLESLGLIFWPIE